MPRTAGPRFYLRDRPEFMKGRDFQRQTAGAAIIYVAVADSAQLRKVAAKIQRLRSAFGGSSSVRFPRNVFSVITVSPFSFFAIGKPSTSRDVYASANALVRYGCAECSADVSHRNRFTRIQQVERELQNAFVAGNPEAFRVPAVGASFMLFERRKGNRNRSID